MHSRNLATVNLVYDIGVEPIRKRLALLDVPHVPKDLSIALGNLGLNPLKMAQIYTVFSNQGHMIEPRLVSKIVSRSGTVLYETFPKEIADFTRPEQAYLMTDILRDVVRRGTGRRAQVEGIELAGKTGTTNKGVDAWFCGYSPTVTTIAWYGRDTNRPIGKHATGGSVAAPAFAAFYRELLELYPDTPRTFKRSEKVMDGEVDGHTELYTAISPLPGATNKPPVSIAAMFHRNATPEHAATVDPKPKRAEGETDEVEVVPISEEDAIEAAASASPPAEPKPPEPIDPIHLKPKPPQPVGGDGEALF